MSTSPPSAKKHARAMSRSQPSKQADVSPPSIAAVVDEADEEPDFDAMPPDELAKWTRECTRVLREMRTRCDELERERDGAQGELDGVLREYEEARDRVGQLMHDEARIEEELAGRIEVIDKLRASVRDLEKQRKDNERRYREQSDSFDRERQSWQDQEQHYKSRIANLSNANRKARPSRTPGQLMTPSSSEQELERTEEQATSSRPSTPRQQSNDTPNENELALQEQLNTLTTAHDSLSSTMQALRKELAEVKRCYADLQEQNESYEVLLGERTLTGDIRSNALFHQNYDDDEATSETSEPKGLAEDDVDPLLKMKKEQTAEDDEDDEVNVTPSRRRNRRGQKRQSSARPSAGGLDLAAELEAANSPQPKTLAEETGTPLKADKPKSSKEAELRRELKQLKDANRALTLYVSKIVDRVCSQEGFEKVLAVDYRGTDKEKPLDEAKASSSKKDDKATADDGSEPIKFRTTRMSYRETTAPPALTKSTSSRTILGFNVPSVFGGGSTKPTPPTSREPSGGFKPFLLDARKVDTVEDEEDFRERARLKAHMALHGIDNVEAGNASWKAANGTTTSGTANNAASSSSSSGPGPGLGAPAMNQRRLSRQSLASSVSSFTSSSAMVRKSSATSTGSAPAQPPKSPVIDEHESSATAEAAEEADTAPATTTTEARTKGTKAKKADEEEPVDILAFGRRLKRMSMGGWTSPNPSSS